MIDMIQRLNAVVNGFVWGWPMILLLMGTALLLTILSGGLRCPLVNPPQTGSL